MRKITSLTVTLALLLNIVLFTFASPAKAEGIEDLDVIWVDSDECYDFTDGIARVTYNDEHGFPYKFGAIDKNGKLVISIEFDHIGEFNNGLAWAKKGNVTGYIDKTGKFVKQCDYAIMHESEGIATVRRVNSEYKCYGLINKDGNFILPIKYDYIGEMSEGLTVVIPDLFEDKTIYVDKTGKKVLEIEGNSGDFKEGLAYIIKNNKYGFIDKTGKVVIPTTYDYVSDFNDGLAHVRKDDKRGYIDKSGKEVLPIKYDSISDFKEGLAVVGNDWKYGYVDKTGKEVIPLIYDFAWDFSEGLARVRIEEKDEEGNTIIKEGYIDKTGKLAIPAIYDCVGDFKEGVAVVSKGDKSGYIDKTGREVVPIVFHRAYASSDGMMRVRDDNGRYGYMKNPFKNKVQALPSQSKIVVDEEEIELEAYTIKGNNYFKLRDLAMALNGTSKQFEVKWDSKTNAINILTSKPYTPVGGELTVTVVPSVKDAVLSSSIVKIDEDNSTLTAYTIEGSNYFKLRDIAKALNIGVSWEAKTNTVIINTASQYSE